MLAVGSLALTACDSSDSSKRTDGPTYRPSTYGASGDGATDDTAAVQRALTTASRSGGGTVLITAAHRVRTLRVPSNVTLTGGSDKAVLIAATAAPLIQITQATNVIVRDIVLDIRSHQTGYGIIVGNGGRRVEFRGCTVLGSDHSHAFGIECRDGSANVAISTCDFTGFGTPIRLSNAPHVVTIQGCTFTDWTERAIALRGTHRNTLRNVTIEDNRIHPPAPGGRIRQPIQVNGDARYPFKGVRVIGNTVRGLGTDDKSPTQPGTADQIMLHHCHGFEVRDNISEYGGEVGITIARECVDGVVSGNIARYNDSVGILIGATSSTFVANIQVFNNLCLGNGQNRGSNLPFHALSGIAVRKARNVIVRDNTLQAGPTSSQRFGISVGESTNVTIPENNRFEGTMERRVLQLSGRSAEHRDL